MSLLEISPGPDMMLVLARGIGQGKRTALFTVVGMMFVAGIVQVSMLVLGLATVIHTYPTALNLLRWAGAVYLIWLGLKMLAASASAHTRAKSVGPISDREAVWQGAINSLTNPKSLLFMFAFLPQFIDPAQGACVVAVSGSRRHSETGRHCLAWRRRDRLRLRWRVAWSPTRN
nr:LysE family translocator [Paraburkholderia sp. Ac-20347]